MLVGETEELMTNSFLKAFWHEEEGQDLVEYSLLLAFVAMAAIAILISAGGSIKNLWVGINTQLTNVAAS